MKLILIHGAPATGKSTVARALASLTDIPLVDNHAAIDIARMVFGFAEPGFWRLVHELRVTTLRCAAEANVPALITTSAYIHPDDEPLLRDFEKALGDGDLCPVHLSCSTDEQMRRVSSPERAARGKIASPEGLREYVSGREFGRMRRDACFALSTEMDAPEIVAAAIIDQFGLKTV